MLASWEYKDEAADTLDIVNVVTAAYVTAQARLKLYSYLEKLGDRATYYDTGMHTWFIIVFFPPQPSVQSSTYQVLVVSDSILYIAREGEWDVPTGSSLGEMTDELEEYGPGSYITEFSSAGPKNYSYTVYSPTTGKYHQTCKVKGFNLNYQVAQHINAEVMKQLVQGEMNEVSVEQSQIRRSNTHQLVTMQEAKVYRACLEKRKFTDDYESQPYGFKRSKIDEETD